MSTPADDVTAILAATGDKDVAAAAELLAVVSEELRKPDRQHGRNKHGGGRKSFPYRFKQEG